VLGEREVSQPIPSTCCPVALVAVPVSGGTAGIGTPSGPAGPAAGAARSVPSVLSEASLSLGEPPAVVAVLPPLSVTASVMPTATRTAATAAPMRAALPPVR